MTLREHRRRTKIKSVLHAIEEPDCQHITQEIRELAECCKKMTDQEISHFFSGYVSHAKQLIKQANSKQTTLL